MLHKVRRLSKWLSKSPPEAGADGLPLPPAALRRLVAGTDDKQWFLEGGQLAAETIKGILRRNGLDLSQFEAMLDFGCGCGRVVRVWCNMSKLDIHGCDYNPRLVRWCQSNLGFASYSRNDLYPPLSYHDDQFDFIYALSVFTHLPEVLQGRWMQELTRILRPKGYLFITTHGEFYLKDMSPQQRNQFLGGQLVVHRPLLAGRNNCAAFHPVSYIQETMAREFQLVDHVPEGAKGNPYQDATLLQLDSK